MFASELEIGPISLADLVDEPSISFTEPKNNTKLVRSLQLSLLASNDKEHNFDSYKHKPCIFKKKNKSSGGNSN